MQCVVEFYNLARKEVQKVKLMWKLLSHSMVPMNDYGKLIKRMLVREQSKSVRKTRRKLKHGSFNK